MSDKWIVSKIEEVTGSFGGFRYHLRKGELTITCYISYKRNNKETAIRKMNEMVDKLNKED